MLDLNNTDPDKVEAKFRSAFFLNCQMWRKKKIKIESLKKKKSVFEAFH